MANRFLSVNEDNQLPPEVQAAIVAPVQTHFQALANTASAASASASASASAASIDATAADVARIAAEAAASAAVTPTEEIVEEVVAEALSGKRDVAPTLLPAVEHNLNDYVTPGTYVQMVGAQATLLRNYPVAIAGYLAVEGSGDQNYQTFTTLSSSPAIPSRTFRRNRSSNGWTIWSEEISGTNRAVMEPLATSEIFHQATFTAISTHVETWGRFVPKLVTKFIAGNNTATGTALKPTRADLATIPGVAAPAVVRSNSSGWRVPGSAGTTSGNENEIIGLQIKDGVLIHDFDNIGSVALGFKASGEARIYRSSTWTGAQVVADGVVDSFCFGPALIENGVTATIAGTERAGRTLLGQRPGGQVVLTHIFGVTGSSGATFQECANFMRDWWGCSNVVALDGGGSSQLMIDGIRAQPSSDAGEMRPLPDSLVINARVTKMPDTDWTTLPLAAGFTATEAIRIPQYRRVRGEIQLRGRVFGSIPAGTYTTVGNLPNYFKSSRGGTGVGVGQGGVSGIVTVVPDSLAVQGFVPSAVGWLDLGDFRYVQAQA